MKPSLLVRADWDELKRQTVDAGLHAPYLALMGWNLEEDVKDTAALGFDAVSAYARGGTYIMEQPSYEEQRLLLQKQLWEQWAQLQVPCVTLASAGWDTRPRNERPPDWIRELKVEPAPDPVPFYQQRPLIDSVTATPEELASPLLEAIEWTSAHRNSNPANTVILTPRV